MERKSRGRNESRTGDRMSKDEKTRVLSGDQRRENKREESRAVPAWYPKVDRVAEWFLNSPSQPPGLLQLAWHRASWVQHLF